MTTVELDPARLPRHVAIIMDGNGRWAAQRGLSRLHGHRVGKDSVRAVVESARKLGIRYLSLFAFSTENWNRPPKEVDGLMQLLPRTARDVAPYAGLSPGDARALHAVPTNVRLGTTLLRRLLDKYDGSNVKA